MNGPWQDAADEEHTNGSIMYEEAWSYWDVQDDVSSRGQSHEHSDCCQRPDSPRQQHELDELEHLQQGKSPPRIVVESLPPQLHPAVSAGMRRISSCYFSIHSNQSSDSVADLLSLCWSETAAAAASAGEASPQQPRAVQKDGEEVDNDWLSSFSGCTDLLYHDILMNVFTYLDAPSLTAFSETARRPNFEVFYFLQLQLQRALLCGKNCEQDNDNEDPLSGIAGVGSIARLAALDYKQAEDTVQTFLDSNSTLRQMPLSHSLAYLRQVLRRNGFKLSMLSTNNKLNASTTAGASPQAMASAALLVALVGAASFMSATAGGETATFVTAENLQSVGNELPNILLRLGFVGGLMGAARHMSETTVAGHNSNNRTLSMRQRAEQLARMMQEIMSKQWMYQGDGNSRNGASDAMRSMQFPSLTRMMYAAYSVATGAGKASPADVGGSDEEIRRLSRPRTPLPRTPNPYEHLPDHPTVTRTAQSNSSGSSGNSNDEISTDTTSSGARQEEQPEAQQPPVRMPSGCVGAYSRAVAFATSRVREKRKEMRKTRFLALPQQERRELATAFIDACSSDDSLHILKDIVQTRGTIDVEGFYVGSDGTETCALHAAAFHGATRILELLCNSINESDPSKDGGLCNVNLKDVNGWTAAHFAAGANSVSSIQTLALHGADLDIEASNGYTPLQWALRLQNEQVASELRQRVADSDQRRPLTAIANRFFAMIPTHS